jgi:hypothetical protein
MIGRRAKRSSRIAPGLWAAVPWRPVASLTVVGVLLVVTASIWVTGPLAAITVTVGLGAFTAASAHLLDEPAAEAVDATPTTLRERTLARATTSAGVLALGVTALVPLAIRSGSAAPLAIALQMAGCGLVALASAATLRRRLLEPGEVVGSALVALILALGIVRPFDRWIDLLPRGEGDRWAGSCVAWSVVAVASLVALVSATRDPLDRGR